MTYSSYWYWLECSRLRIVWVKSNFSLAEWNEINDKWQSAWYGYQWHVRKFFFWCLHCMMKLCLLTALQYTCTKLKIQLLFYNSPPYYRVANYWFSPPDGYSWFKINWLNLLWVYAFWTILCSSNVLKYNFSKWWLEAQQSKHRQKSHVI